MSIIPMTSTSFSGAIASGDDMALELVTGNDAKGNPSYALLLLPANKVNNLKIALSTKDVVLENFGKVLATGEGHEPPADLVDDIMGLLTKK